MSIPKIFVRVGPILKQRDGADGFSRLLPVLPSVSLWLCQCTSCFEQYFVHIQYYTFPNTLSHSVCLSVIQKNTASSHYLFPFVSSDRPVFGAIQVVTHGMSTYAEQRKHITSTVKSSLYPWRTGTQECHWRPAWKGKIKRQLHFQAQLLPSIWFYRISAGQFSESVSALQNQAFIDRSVCNTVLLAS